jgi:protein-arginine kinase activator protein McsA
MNEAGIIDEKTPEQTGFGIGMGGAGAERRTASASPASKLEELRAKLNEAIAKEDYERAAKIRDEISKLQSRS